MTTTGADLDLRELAGDGVRGYWPVGTDTLLWLPIK